MGNYLTKLILHMVELYKKKTEPWVFSKYVLSNVFHYLPIKDALRIRLASRKLDEACLIGFRINLDELKAQADKYLYVISTKWDKESQQNHQELRWEELEINLLLKKFIKDCVKPTNGFHKDYRELTHLVKPNHLII